MKKINILPILLLIPVMSMMIISVLIVNHYFLEINSFSQKNLEEITEQQNIIKLLHNVSNNISEIQTKVNFIIKEASKSNISMLEIYREHTKIVDNLGSIYIQLETISNKEYLNEVMLDDLSNLLSEYNEYRANIIMTTDIVAIAPEEAEKYVSLAKTNYITYSVYANNLLKYISETISLNLTNQTDRQNEVFSNIFISLIVGLIITFLISGIIVFSLNSYIIKLLEKNKNDAEKLKILNNEKEKLIATKNKFFAIISHDLKNPLNAIIGFSHLLLQDCSQCKSNEKYNYIKLINESGERTLNLLNNLLTWSQSQLGNITFSPELIDINKYLMELNLEMAYLAQEKKIELVFKEDTRYLVHTDKNMLETVIRNIITNAIKFTYKNGKVIIKYEVYNLNSNFIKISIIDNGVGMSKDTLEKLFNLEHHISKTGTIKETGTGLGLILCKEFINKMGGEIFVESELDKGTTFSFTLPRKT